MLGGGNSQKQEKEKEDNCGGEELEGGKVQRKSGNNMLTNTHKQKRLTRHVRIDTKWHKFLKFEAVRQETTMSKLLDKALNGYFDVDFNKLDKEDWMKH